MAISKAPLKSVREREKELQALLASATGRKELEELESRYRAATGKMKPANASAITFILVHERERGLIQN